ncbi:hypothetical protein [Pseudoflavonifractor sp. 524-17]|uniref:hypothetical protein n=1 Tax=Pseudoflavonifractor sp. 524-17 TaxID=2304577 RepID=UPI00137B8EDE|nr:hypothetical protein [Pseudoflavonifractor sp. 524-17]
MTKADIFHATKEVFESKDAHEVAKMIQSEQWVIVNAAFQGPDICWCLVRIL